MPVFVALRRDQFNLRFTYHSDAILHGDFPEAGEELDRLISTISIPIVEVIRGGGEAPVTQRLRRSFSENGWQKGSFRVEKRINDQTTFAQSHEVDHVKDFGDHTIAMEIEWNNKDPFFDRDLENFNRLHADGAISIGIIVTRGDTFQIGIEERIRVFALANRIRSFEDLEDYGTKPPTPRQRDAVNQHVERNACSFAEAWAACFTRDKFGTVTTHWSKLEDRLRRGVGSPCPTVGIGIPLSRVTE